jgi:hypothetical protein
MSEARVKVRIAPLAVPDGIDSHREETSLREEDQLALMDLLGATEAVEEEHHAPPERLLARRPAQVHQRRRALMCGGYSLSSCVQKETRLQLSLR